MSEKLERFILQLNAAEHELMLNACRLASEVRAERCLYAVSLVFLVFFFRYWTEGRHEDLALRYFLIFILSLVLAQISRLMKEYYECWTKLQAYQQKE
jgi:hypothetical protein